MTVADKIFELNKEFQMLYHFPDFHLFTNTAPSLINEIKFLLSSTINEEHPLRFSVNKHLELLDLQIMDMSTLSKRSGANEWVKDKWLNGFKINVSNVCWGFKHECWNFNEAILHQKI